MCSVYYYMQSQAVTVIVEYNDIIKLRINTFHKVVERLVNVIVNNVLS